jgi:hypothetical protein
MSWCRWWCCSVSVLQEKELARREKESKQEATRAAKQVDECNKRAGELAKQEAEVSMEGQLDATLTQTGGHDSHRGMAAVWQQGLPAHV